MTPPLIRIRGARQHNLKNLDVDIRTGEMTVVTGPSGSGKSSLVFDTLYAEGQRRYVETFSAYARQFLDRMDKPAVDKVEGVPPAIAIDQTNPVRSSRSTVGTMTELNDHLKLLFARAGQLFDAQTALPVRHDSADSIYAELLRRAAAAGDPRVVLTFAVALPASATADEVQQWLSASGFTRVHTERTEGGQKLLDVVADRFRLGRTERARVVEAIEVALRRGGGQLTAYALPDEPVDEPVNAGTEAGADKDADKGPDKGPHEGPNKSPNKGPDTHQGAGEGTGQSAHAAALPAVWRFSTGLHCPESGLRYREPLPSMFSFNSPVGACDSCRGFGRVIGVDWSLVIPNERLSLRAGCIKPIQTPAWKECQDDLMRHAEAAGIPRDTPWAQLAPAQRAWVLDGSPNFKEGNWSKQWYGIKRFFQYLESKAYKMHIRVLLSKYRSYTACGACGGARLKTESLLWRVGSQADANAVLPPAQRFMPQGVGWTRAQLESLPGLGLHDVMLLPIERLRQFIERLASTSKNIAPGASAQDSEGLFDVQAAAPAASAPSADAQARRLILQEIQTRLKYLCDVGLGYLTLDRQSRTLSGGEVQRINLTTALGTSLVNTLFVLDEPSIGLHPRDMARINQAMQRLKNAGNTLVVVEHDPAVMLAADRVLDFGPGPGSAGGRIVFDGTPQQLKQADTLTGAYLGARKRIGMGQARPVADGTPRLLLQGARQHNLKGIDLAFPLQRLVTVTGVSGSGKSTLVQDVLAPALMRHFGQPSEAPGAHECLLGAEQLAGCVFVDQSPIGKTARSNPASYVGAWDAIRKLFADAPLARQRGYTAAKFSFNSGDGRCPTCGGSGFEHVEMQFLSDVYLRCPDCDGQRYRPEVLQVRIERPASTSTSTSTSASAAESAESKTTAASLNVADVLALTVADAARLFAQDREVIRALQPLVDVGLDYVTLGQPVPTLSGGEAQRLKLAGFLAEAAASASASRQPVARKGTLFLFDEPTTGLHFDDIAKLMRAFRKLLDAGHSLIVIEHNLDVMRASDWLIDLGPEGGDAGGHIVAQGTPQQVAAHPTSHTGAALRDYAAALAGSAPAAAEAATEATTTATPAAALSVQEPRPAYLASPAPVIDIVNAREHNLKNLSVQIPRGKFNVITGVSGSGKSTLAFDILFGEGQRRYLESLNAYARSIVQPAGRPDVDAVHGIPPTVAIEQRLSRGGRKSTVGTATEVWHFLRLLYVKLGVQHCTHDGAPVQPQTPERIAAQIISRYSGQTIGLLAPLVVGRKGLYTELADWARPRGYTHLRVDGEFVPTAPFPRLDRFKEHTIELPVHSLQAGPGNEAELRQHLARALEHGKGVVHVLHGIESLAAAMQAGAPTAGIGQVQVFSTKRACPVCDTSYAELDPRLFSYNSKHGWCPDCVGTGLALTRAQRQALDDSVLGGDSSQGREHSFAEADVQDLSHQPCPTCHGSRLNAVARHVLLQGVPPLPASAQASADESPAATPATNASAGKSTGESAGKSAGESADKSAALHTAGLPITHLARLSVRDLRQWFDSLHLQGRDADIARDLLPEIKSRLAFLEQVGLGYLTLDRGAPTLSGGEAQRIRLAAQLGSNLQGVCYVLDEPTIGLHARDNRILLDALHSLSSKGNTLVVVEHDEDTIRRAEHLIDIGPGAGQRGGRLVAQGSAADLAAAPESATGRYLRQAMHHPLHPRRPVPWPAALPTPAGATPAQAPTPASTSAPASKNIAAKPRPTCEDGIFDAPTQPAPPAAPGTGPGPTAGNPQGEPKSEPQSATTLNAAATAAALQTLADFPAANAPGWLWLQGAHLHNLRHINAALPLKRLVAVTGVSGSGKSTFARDVLLASVRRFVRDGAAPTAQAGKKTGQKNAVLAQPEGAGSYKPNSSGLIGCQALKGFGQIDRVLEVDQTPIGKTPRSCPATYIGFWDSVRKLFADTLEARARGWGPARFSFNTGEGRCPGCDGQGMRTIEMAFLPDVKVPCEVCRGARFNPETLAVTWRGKNIGQVLQMEVDEAVGFFASMPAIAHPLQLLQDVGLGYLTLGQPSPTLSGGEAQRIKLVAELSKVRDDITRRGSKTPHTLYVLDEPTVGLHMQDVEKLIHVLHRLVNAGHSVIVIEHDLDLIAEADWIIDLGPEGGTSGGQLVAAGTPEAVVCAGTHTGQAIAGLLRR